MIDGIRIAASVVVALGFLFVCFVNCPAGPLNPQRSHHTGDGYRNNLEYEAPGFFDFIKWRVSRIGKNIPGPGDYDFPLADNDPEFLQSNTARTTLTWIGHATVLLQLDGKNILTDPHFSKRASPVQWAGPERVVAPGVSLEDLPRIDIVVISHDHYDSLDRSTVKALFAREGGGETVFFVPLGLQPWFENLGITRVVELDWWDQREEKGLEIIAVPVKHWSKRTVFSRNNTLWAGWVIRTDHFRFFFCGDTGYTPEFKEIGNRLGPFDLSAIPIGAYEPRWFMRHHHINPEEAVQVHRDVRSKKSVAIHWGTFILTDEPLDEPPGRLIGVREDNNMPPDEFLILKHGETILLE